MSDDDSAEAREFPGQYVRIRGRVSRAGQVTWSPCLRTDTGPDQRAAARPPAADAAGAAVAILDQYTVIQLDNHDQAVGSATVTPQFRSPDQDRASFTARLPFDQRVRAVVLRLGGRELGRLTVPPDRPHFTLQRPKQDDDFDPTGVLHLHWAGHDAGHPTTFFVRFSHNGCDWVRPGVNLTTNDFYLDLTDMPGGDRCIVQVIATNGYRTSYAQTRHFAVPMKPPDILLTNSAGPVLSAQGFSRQHGPITGDTIRWLADDGTELARGPSFDVRSLSSGVHAVRVSVADGSGQVSTSDVGSYDATTGQRVITVLPL
jgi:hypothetical protein